MSSAASSDPLEVVEVGALNEAEAGYVRAARAANTLRGAGLSTGRVVRLVEERGLPRVGL